MIKSHNEVVKKDDIVYHLGDFTFRNPWIATDILYKLNGKHYFVAGNHDEWFSHPEYEKATKPLYDRGTYFGVRDYHELKLNHNGERVHLVMFHFPLLTWHKGHKGSIMLHGHTHGNIDNKNVADGVKRIDVGVDSAYKLFGKYRPFRLNEIVDIANTRNNNTLDFGKE